MSLLFWLTDSLQGGCLKMTFRARLVLRISINYVTHRIQGVLKFISYNLTMLVGNKINKVSK